MGPLLPESLSDHETTPAQVYAAFAAHATLTIHSVAALQLHRPAVQIIDLRSRKLSAAHASTPK